MNPEQLEFSISQYLDGTLPPLERTALERVLAENSEARALLNGYRRVNIVLQSSPLPTLNFDVLAASISAAIDDAEEQRIALRYRMPSWARAAALPLTLAASILIVAGIWIKSNLSHPSKVAPSSIMAIEIGPPTQAPTGPSQMDVSIGPGTAADDQPLIVQYSNDIISRPSHVTIASGGPPVQDIGASPSFDIE